MNHILYALNLLWLTLESIAQNPRQSNYILHRVHMSVLRFLTQSPSTKDELTHHNLGSLACRRGVYRRGRAAKARRPSIIFGLIASGLRRGLRDFRVFSMSSVRYGLWKDLYSLYSNSDQAQKLSW